MLREAGLQDVRVRPTARATHVGEYYQTFLPTIAGLVRDVIIAGTDVADADFHSCIAAVLAHLNTPGTVTCQPLMWQAWGRRPQ
jgi:hypothetical protein